MSYSPNDPRREAERLRIIVETLAYTNPGMTMDEAVPVLWEIEQRTAKLEAPEAGTQYIDLPNDLPETIALFIDLQPDIQAELKSARKIHAIKLVRARTFKGLKESKEGVEHWEATRMSKTAPASVPRTSASLTTAVCAWIDTKPDVQGHLRGLIGTDSTGVKFSKITGIKKIRTEYVTSSGYRLGLIEAKDAAEEWIRTR